MGLRRVEDFYAYQLASTFSRSESAPAHITEGFSRFNPGDFARFLDFAIGALAEAERWLRAGSDRGYFDPAEVESAQTSRLESVCESEAIAAPRGRETARGSPPPPKATTAASLGRRTLRTPRTPRTPIMCL